jgi:hypothetical protein
MLINKTFQGQQMQEASEEIQGKKDVDFHRHICLNLNGFNSRNLPKPGE